MMRRVALVWLLACLLAQGLRAQYPLVRPITLRDGQRALQVRHLVQDDMGMLWVGGDRGLFRTDGDRTDAILKQEQGTITALHAQGTDVHAALSNGQIVRCDGAGCDTVYTGSAFTQAPIRSLVVDPTSEFEGVTAPEHPVVPEHQVNAPASVAVPLSHILLLTT